MSLSSKPSTTLYRYSTPGYDKRRVKVATLVINQATKSCLPFDRSKGRFYSNTMSGGDLEEQITLEQLLRCPEKYEVWECDESKADEIWSAASLALIEQVLGSDSLEKPEIELAEEYCKSCHRIFSPEDSVMYKRATSEIEETMQRESEMLFQAIRGEKTMYSPEIILIPKRDE